MVILTIQFFHLEYEKKNIIIWGYVGEPTLLLSEISIKLVALGASELFVKYLYKIEDIV